VRGNVTNNGVHPKHGEQRRFVKAIAPFRDKETDVLKKTFAIGGLAIAAATGVLLTSSPASAQVPTWGGGGGWSSHHFHFRSHHRNFNANENELFNRIRIRIRNRNNNIAIARNDQAQAQRENQRQLERQQERQRQDEDPANNGVRRGPGPGAPGV
jgi:hypothetical protein